MSNEEIEDILEELHLVRPEILKPKAKKIFEAIMIIADERDELQQENKQLKERIDKAIKFLENSFISDVDGVDEEVWKVIEILKGENNEN